MTISSSVGERAFSTTACIRIGLLFSTRQAKLLVDIPGGLSFRRLDSLLAKATSFCGTVPSIFAALADISGAAGTTSGGGVGSGGSTSGGCLCELALVALDLRGVFGFEGGGPDKSSRKLSFRACGGLPGFSEVEGLVSGWDALSEDEDLDEDFSISFSVGLFVDLVLAGMGAALFTF